MMARNAKAWLARLLEDKRGAAAFMMAASVIPGIAALGSAVDAGRIYVVKSQLQAGVDSAALAGARAFQVSGGQPDSRESQVATYFADNFPVGYLGSQSLALAPTFTKQEGVNTTIVQARLTLPMSFMKVFGYTQQSISAIAKAEIQPRPLEVMMVLDNTGSMKDMLPKDSAGVQKTRITALKDASKSFFDVLFQGSDTRPDLAIGMVTYDITVNVGRLLTDWNANSVRQLFGFNDSYMAQTNGSWPTQPLAWKGCVFGDETVRDLNGTLTYREPGAWDIDRTLPSEGAHPSVMPYFIPPMYVPAGGPSSDKTLPTNNYYDVTNNVEANNNLYKLHSQYYDIMLNPRKGKIYNVVNPYRRWFYQMYIGLNDTDANSGNDVITAQGGGFYNPKTRVWDPSIETNDPFDIDYSRIPNFGKYWKEPTQYIVNPLGGSAGHNNGANFRTEWPTPNWQCPEAAVSVTYGRPKSFYVDQINNKNAAIYPANGTLHHAGLLWGYRLLVRNDVFKRDNPTNEDPKRALVFMTDGETSLGTTQNGHTDRTWTFYGNFADRPISAVADNLRSQSERRFAKTCASLQAEVNPPRVYIVALTTTDTGTLSMFEKCAPGHVYRTSDAATLKAAFNDIAAELVDLHLVK